MSKYKWEAVGENVVIEVLKDDENDGWLKSTSDNKVKPKICRLLSKGDDVPQSINVNDEYLISAFSGYEIPDLEREMYVINHNFLMTRRVKV